jgi:hypothetical protein
MVWKHAVGYALLMISAVLFDLDGTLLDHTTSLVAG